MLTVEGVENRFLVPDLIAKESLYRLKHALVLPRISNRTFEHNFESKIGNKINVKRPFKARSQKGRIFKKAAMIDKYVDIMINERHHFALQVVDEDVVLRIVDYGARYLQTGAEELAYDYDIAGANELGMGLFLSEGTPGSDMTLTMGQDIRALAQVMAIPENSQNFALLSPYDEAQISHEILGPRGSGSATIAGIDNPGMLEDAIRTRFMGKFANWNVLTSTHIPHLVVEPIAANGAPLVNGNNQRGSRIATDGWGVNSTKILNKGQLITFANVEAVQPRGDRRSTGELMTFLVTEDVSTNGSGEATIPVYPELNFGKSATDTEPKPTTPGQDFDGSGVSGETLDASAYQTVIRKDNAAATGVADNAVVTVLGSPAAGSRNQRRTYRQGIFFCGDALEYVNIALPTPKSAVYGGTQTDPETGCIMSYLSFFDGTEMTESERLDIFFGVKTIYPEIGIRWLGPQV